MAAAALPAHSWLKWPRTLVVVVILAGGVLALVWGVAIRGFGPSSTTPSDQFAQRFVAIGLKVGELFPAEVDSYFGPAALKPSASSVRPSLQSLKTEVAQLQRDIGAAPGPQYLRLKERTARLAALVEVLQAATQRPFDEEAQRLYGLGPARVDTAQFDRARSELERLLPGPGSLTDRVEAFRNRFIVPEDRRPAVFARALTECRARTLRHWKLPAAERLEVEWTTEVGAAWHRYQGAFRSALQVNPQAVAFVGSMIDVACHEGYPGHHAQFVLAEAQVGAGRLPVEDTLVLLRSPGSVVREGAADYGVSLVFPAADRLAFERDVLFPMIGFAPAEAARFEQIRALLDQLAPAALPILRAYRDNRTTSQAASAALDSEALIASPEPLLGFVDSVGAYVAGYTVVREQVRGVIDTGPPLSDDVRWGRLRCVLRLADEVPFGQITARVARDAGRPESCSDNANEVKQ